MTQIGKNIKKIRNVRGVSQQAFADLFQLTRGNISSYEEFRAEPKIEVVIKIANFFGIPLGDFIEKDLSVNELLHYNTELVVETQKLKITQQLQQIPYVPVLYLNDYVRQYKDAEFLHSLPTIIVPVNSKIGLLAFEIESAEMLPAGFDYKNGDLLIVEEVVKENIHRIGGRLGMMVDEEELKIGIYEEENAGITLKLNDWVKYPFDIDSGNHYWVLKASFRNLS